MGSFNDSIAATLRFERPEFICQFEWGYWWETVARWKQEGMPGERPWESVGITCYDRVPVQTRIFPGFEPAVLSETAETRIVRDWGGVVQEVPKSGSTRFPRFIRHPRLIISGGIDKREIAKGRAAIDRELEAKLPPLFRRGGYLPSLDHHVPPEVSYDNFRYYVQRVQELYAKHGGSPC